MPERNSCLNSIEPIFFYDTLMGFWLYGFVLFCYEKKYSNVESLVRAGMKHALIYYIQMSSFP